MLEAAKPKGFEDGFPNPIKEETPKNILFGAGTIHKGLKFSSTWNLQESLVGATSGGSKLEIKPEIVQVEIDGANVPIQGLDVKTGGTATMEINFVELTPELMKTATLGKIEKSKVTGYDAISDKADIETGDYWDNVAFVGKTLSGKPIIAILENALCTDGLGIDGKSKDKNTGKYVFRCSQKLGADPNVLPWHIYYPQEV